MSPLDAPTRGPARPGPYIIAGIILAVGVVLPLVVPLYAKLGPALFGFPFFYWYQILWVFIEAGLLWITFVIVTREDKRRREAIRGDRQDSGEAAEGGRR